MNQIVKPQGKPIRRIIIETDNNGQTQVNAANPAVLNPVTGLPMPLEAVEVITSLIQVALGLLAGIAEAQKKKARVD